MFTIGKNCLISRRDENHIHDENQRKLSRQIVRLLQSEKLETTYPRGHLIQYNPDLSEDSLVTLAENNRENMGWIMQQESRGRNERADQLPKRRSDRVLVGLTYKMPYKTTRRIVRASGKYEPGLLDEDRCTEAVAEVHIQEKNGFCFCLKNHRKVR
ncbi:hypothetical protein MTP99_007395 [Tenebrio molitor]|jgi:hypothetical protein|nr:hypothetical protein MTP99_007395 [Tenebrio molitor]